ncbi:hypothetical protein PR048_030585 [Dryococelus australis]|uniref:Uncharacterized protein n=1 Tax=Dryococelus australis TaxID=614101 RepID=A0ABQ9G9D9_9NEOP|nr:hypothetical protein PR048_030585 [Dryococelus australis]
MEQRWSARVEETGDSRENPPTRGIVRHDSNLQISGVTRPGIEPGPCAPGLRVGKLHSIDEQKRWAGEQPARTNHRLVLWQQATNEDDLSASWYTRLWTNPTARLYRELQPRARDRGGAVDRVFSPPTYCRRNKFYSRRRRLRDSCQIMPLVGGFSRGYSVPLRPIPALLRTYLRFTLIGSQHLDAKSRPNLLRSSLHFSRACQENCPH